MLIELEELAKQQRAGWFTRICLLLPAILACAGAANDVAAEPPRYGIAVLASGIGRDYALGDLVELIEHGRFSPVIIDWAWITYHWERTDFPAVRELLKRLREKKIEVAAMYRPRSLGAFEVPEQVKTDGSPAFAHGHYACFSSPSSRQWSVLWGEKVLENCPDVGQVLIYNPLDICECPGCRRLKAGNPYGGTWAFLAEAKRAWRQRKPTVKLGVVFNPDSGFWLAGKDIVDNPWPFFHVREEADFPGNAQEIAQLQSTLGRKIGLCLAKVTWGPEDTISISKLSQFARAVRKSGLTGVLWTFDTLLLSPRYDRRKIAEALDLDYAAISAPLERMATGPRTAAPRGDLPPTLSFPTVEAKTEKLPWPHQAPGLSAQQIEQLNREVWVINNSPLFQADERGDWCYLHGGLDIVLTNGARIYAMKDGWVKATAHSAVTVADAQDDRPCYGWSYTHLGHIRVGEGDFVKRGTLLGEVDFNGLPHTHLEKVFSQGGYWHSWRYVCFPDDHFTFSDDEAPTIETPFYFFEHKKDEWILPQPDGRIAVRGDMDIVVAMRDGGKFAHRKEDGFGDRLAVARINYTIAPAGKEPMARNFHSFDFRKLRFLSGLDFSARQYSTRLAKTVYKHWALFGKSLTGDRNLSYYIISNCSGDAAPTELDLVGPNHCWHAAARDKTGVPFYPDGEYVITVTAFDSHGNEANRAMRVTVDNRGALQIRTKEPIKPETRTADGTAAPFRGSSGLRPATPQDIRQTGVDEWFGRIGRDAEAGYLPFTALNALIARARENPANRDEVVRQATTIIDNKQQPMAKRWQCCYVLSGIGDERGIAVIARALNDESQTVRAVAACALGAYAAAEARSALEAAAKTETAPRVQEEIKKALKGGYRK